MPDTLNAGSRFVRLPIRRIMSTLVRSARRLASLPSAWLRLTS